MQQCDKHLAYLGLGIFLELKERTPFNIIGTITGEDPETYKHLLASVTQPIKLEEQSDYIETSIKQHATAAAGSKSQLERVGKEMQTTTRILALQKFQLHQLGKKVAGSSNICIKNLWLISTIRSECSMTIRKGNPKYTRNPLPSVNLCSVPGRFSPVKTRSMRFTSVSKRDRKHIIRGNPLNVWSRRSPYRNMFCVSENHNQIEMQNQELFNGICIIKTHKDLNAHHHIYHPNILFKCRSCEKHFSTPSTWKNHKYGCSQQKLYNCDSCNKRFLFSSTLQQHIRCHISQKLFKCFYANVNVDINIPKTWIIILLRIA